ncbi:MAG: FaeA/PapI family transcriptional regulator [Candidatus Altiarchaeales archaeon]|nr:FaeA/PapI family transcriptional regulator [Candidatus Altiarchaeota archaeon]MBU4342121.1 FaeA/PapI family transcriptional regulator [Candidatus Altiarchaeota archaeon]MCG2782308.1 FaeA/PapI family transcriptional regulator [Candidatus Altiarchaeales archaeon]MCG2825823.1 FaeA/PapI family transcriptional regulator [Thermoplasmatales archaeon]
MPNKKPSKRKKRNPEEIKKEIINFIEKLDFPTTTEGIAKGVGLNWFTASFYLSELRSDGKVFHKRVGRQNQWWTEKVDEQRGKIREQEKIIQEKDIKLMKKDEKIEEQAKEIEKLKGQIREMKGRVQNTEI